VTGVGTGGLDAPAGRVEVIVPSWRRSAELDRCLAALAAQHRAPDRVLVVLRPDDAEAHDVVRRRALDLEPVEVVTTERPGQVAALNAALAALAGATADDVVMFVDDDLVADPDWIERACARFATDPRLGGVCGRDRLWQEGVPVTGRTGRRIGSVTWFGRVTSLWHLGPDEVRTVAHLKGCAMAYRATAIAGLRFDERLRGSGAQPFNDTAFSMQVAARGWGLCYDPGLGADHREGRRVGDDLRPGDTVGVLPTKAAADLAYNELLVVLARPGRIGRSAARLWFMLVGSRINPGALQALRAVPSAGPVVAVRRWRVAAQARRAAVRSLRSTATMRTGGAR